MKRRRFMKIWKFMLSFAPSLCSGTCLQLLLTHIKVAARMNRAKEKQKQNPAESKLCWHLISAKTVVRDIEKSVLRRRHYIDTAKSEAREMASWQERRPKLLSNGFPVMITGALEFVHMYVGRHMSYIFYTEILFQYLKRHEKKNNEPKRMYIYMFVCKLRVFVLRKEEGKHISTVEAICWMLKSLCENVKCWRNLQPVTPPPPLVFFLLRLSF